MKDWVASLILRAAKCAMISATLACLTACYVQYDQRPTHSASRGQPTLELVIDQTSPAIAGPWSANLGRGVQDEWVWVTLGVAREGNAPRSATSIPTTVFPFFDPSVSWPGASRLDRDAGTLEFKGSRTHDNAEGRFTFSPNPPYVRDAQTLLVARPSAVDLLRLTLLDVTHAELEAYSKCGLPLDTADLCELKTYRVPPAYVEKVRKGADYSVHEVVRLHSYNVPETYPAEIRRTGWKFPVESIVHIYSYHVSSAEVVGWSKSGCLNGPEDITRLHSYGVTPEFGSAVKATLPTATSDDIIRLKSYGLSEDYLDGIKSAGVKFDANELVRLKSFNVSVDEISAWMKGGYALKSDDLVRLHSYNVTPDYATALNNTNFNAGDLIKLKSYNITAAEVTQWVNAGYNFSVHELVRLKVAGVTPDYADALTVMGRKKLTVDAIIRLRQRGISAEEIRQLRE